ncbi:MAG TPA: AsmA-like C-terminal region-containing protein [Devosia sp.]|nr:AsmA-like C-terminal region-containing protein [Devosia sp.]
MRDLLADRRWRWTASVVVIVLALLAIAANFPFGWLKPDLERAWSRRIGRPVTIGALQRETWFSFTPTIVVRNVRVPQPAWAGKGDFATVARGVVRFNVFSALFGHVRPSSITVSGLRLALVRDAGHRENWRLGAAGLGGGGLALDRLELSDARVSYRDAVQDRRAALALSADRRHGVMVQGKGTIWGHKVTIAAHGPPITDADTRWPFTARLTGDAVGMTATGTMAHPLDIAHLTAEMTAHASDLKLIDAIIEAGLFGTQPVKLAAHVVHDGKSWTVSHLSGTVGHSDFTGHITSKKVGDRVKLAGAVTFGRLDFDDLASDAGLARAHRLAAETGRRLVPNTRINLAHMGPADGVITVNARRLVSKTPSSLTAMRGTLTLDHRRLTADPFRVDLTHGHVSGRIVIDQRDGWPVPRVAIALDLAGADLPTLIGGGGEVTGSVVGRARLVGRGSTFREVVADGDGRIGLVARDGVLPAKVASELGFDIARTLTTGDTKRAGLRCIALGLAMRNGVGTLDPLVIDTTRAQSRGTGTVHFPEETLAIRLTGAPKAKSVLRLPAAIIVGGTIEDPHAALQKGAKSFGNILKAIGRSITGNQPPRATDADCDALAARALG